jgi:group I intron endonuclease
LSERYVPILIVKQKINKQLLDKLQSIKENGKIIGVYLIKNKKSGKEYIGSSLDICIRIKHHKYQLNSGKHNNKLLQSDWKEFGLNAFVWEILEIFNDENKLSVREKFYIDTRNPEYNIKPASSGHGKRREHLSVLGNPIEKWKESKYY